MEKVFKALGIIIDTLSNDKGHIMCRKELDVIIQALTELNQIKEANPSEITLKELVSKHILNPNSVVDVYEQDKNNPHYSDRIFKGMAWEMERHEIGNRKLKYIFSAEAETINESDRVCIEVEE